jgi:hypothetical protein
VGEVSEIIKHHKSESNKMQNLENRSQKWRKK